MRCVQVVSYYSESIFISPALALLAAATNLGLLRGLREGANKGRLHVVQPP